MLKMFSQTAHSHKYVTVLLQVKFLLANLGLLPKNSHNSLFKIGICTSFLRTTLDFFCSYGCRRS